MGRLLEFLMPHLTIILGVMIAVLGVSTLVLYFQVKAAQAAVSVVKQQNATLNGTIKDLQGDVANWQTLSGTCSTKVDQLQTDAKKRADDAAPKQDEAKQNTRVVTKTVIQYVSAPRPLGLTACDNAKRLLNEAIDDRVAAATH